VFDAEVVMRPRWLAVLAAGALLALPATSAFADEHTADCDAEVVVVHGIPGLVVDIQVNGETAIEGFAFGDVVRTTLPPGDYSFSANDPDSGEELLLLGVEGGLQAGWSYTAAAFLSGGEPTLLAFVNENDATGIQPFHLADFGAVAIVADGDIALDGVENGNTARIDVPGGTTVPGVGIAPAGSTEVAIDLGDVTVPDEGVVLAYAIGPDEGEELPTVVTEETAGLRGCPERPTEVDSGTGGLATDRLPLGVAALMALGVLALAAPVVARRRG
jgi:hypothetical protein